MKTILISFFSILISLSVYCQGLNGTELGIDGSFNASSSSIKSGNFGLGLKYGFKFGETIILGPSIRYSRNWSENYDSGTETIRNLWGGGAFIHARFSNVAFIGVQAEFLQSAAAQINSGVPTGSLLSEGYQWVGTCLIGAGLDYGFENNWRLNAGVYYDVLDIPNKSNPENPNPNSPFQPYPTRNNNGEITIIPIVYRISLFIPITE